MTEILNVIISVSRMSQSIEHTSLGSVHWQRHTGRQLEDRAQLPAAALLAIVFELLRCTQELLPTATLQVGGRKLWEHEGIVRSPNIQGLSRMGTDLGTLRPGLRLLWVGCRRLNFGPRGSTLAGMNRR